MNEPHFGSANEFAATPDLAPVFGAAVSLWHAVWKQAAIASRLNLSECYNGGDEFMRIVMRIATGFELWSCEHVCFEELNDVWPYLLEDRFGDACLSVLGGPEALLDFDARNCLRIALRLRLPIKLSEGLPVPVDVVASNPVQGSPFNAFRIRTVRKFAGDSVRGAPIRQGGMREERGEPFTWADDPFDDRFGTAYLALYGVGGGGLLREHIADRETYAEAVRLACCLAPGIEFPETPHSSAEAGRA